MTVIDMFDFIPEKECEKEKTHTKRIWHVSREIHYNNVGVKIVFVESWTIKSFEWMFTLFDFVHLFVLMVMMMMMMI